MAKRMLREAAAWREIARRIAEGKWGRDGLCREAERVAGSNDFLRQAMWERVDAHLTVRNRSVGSWGAYLESTLEEWRATGRAEFTHDRGANADIRVLAALFLSLEAADEARTERAS